MREDALFWRTTIGEAKRVSGILCYNVNTNASVVLATSQHSEWCVPFTPGIWEAFVTGRVSCEKPDEDGRTTNPPPRVVHNANQVPSRHMSRGCISTSRVGFAILDGPSSGRRQSADSCDR